MKRLFDLVFSILGLALFLPLFLVICLIIYLTNGRPIFFFQTRVGKNQKPFLIYKFRTMVVDASDRGGYATESGDFRITPFGRILRRSSLDELPQLLNVLAGDMSLVGPRPDVFEQESLYNSEEWVKRHLVQPGITGLAQATLRSQASVLERKFADIYYVENQSFWLDVLILFKTIRQILGAGGN